MVLCIVFTRKEARKLLLIHLLFFKTLYNFCQCLLWGNFSPIVILDTNTLYMYV